MKKIDNLYRKIIFNENLLNELKRLETFQYGCLYQDGNLVTDLKEISKRSPETIIIQSPEMFLKNKTGMCHDATVYIDFICNQNKINHKCIYISSNLAPEYKTHSFVIVQLLNKKWQVIDVFATKTCLWNEPFNEYYEAIDERINDWILKDNNKSPDIEIYLSNKMPKAGCNFIEFYHKLMKISGKYYTQYEQKDIYECNIKMLKQYDNIALSEAWKRSPKNTTCVMIGEGALISESHYFDDVQQSLENYLITYINKEIKNENYFIQIPISEFAEELLKTKKGNYNCMHQFLDALKTNEIGFIDLKIISNNNCCFSPPIEISKIKIINDDLSTEKYFEDKMTLITNDYEKFMEEKTKNDKSMNDTYKKINNEIKYRERWGEIEIGANYFTKNKDYLNEVIDHEFGHFINFLIRISNINHDMCRYWSRNHHSEYILDKNGNLSNDQKAAYFLDSDEFKQWCSTVINRLCKKFEEESNDFSKENILDYYNYIIKHEIQHNRKYIAKKEENEKIIHNSFKYELSLNFMRMIYHDSLKPLKEGEHRNNNFTIFKKWLLNSLLELNRKH